MAITVMIVDDDQDDRQVLAETIHDVSAAYQIVEAQDGQEGLRMLAMTVPDLIFLDINMPLMDGFAMLAAVRKLTKYAMLPIIMYSTSRRKEDVKKSLDLGASRFVVKPDTSLHVRKIVDEALELIQDKE